jgi:hypothetical protein
VALLFHSANDVRLQRFIVTKSVDRNLHSDAERTQLLRKKFEGIDQVARLARQRLCVRNTLRQYFGVKKKARQSIALRLLEIVFARSQRVRPATWCCDSCDPRWMQKLQV